MSILTPDVRAQFVQQGIDPMAAYASSGHQARRAAERVGGTQAGWGAWPILPTTPTL